MKYKIKIEKNVIKFLEKHSNITRSFFSKLEILQNQWLDNQLDIKKLKGNENKRRLRISKYRFLFRIDKDTIIIYFYDADTRGDVYKKI